MTEKKLILTENEATQDEAPVNVVPLKLLPGGKDTNNWLSNLPLNTVFLTRPKSDPYGNMNLAEGLARLQIVSRTESERAAILFDVINRSSFEVDVQRFSRKMELFEVLGVVGEPTLEE